MRYLIDGYNLLYAMGLLGGRQEGPGGLEKARLRLLGLLRENGGEGAEVTVVFDAIRAPRGAAAEQDCQGIHVRFALRREADELIEELIRRDSAPHRLTVVSDDHRIQQAARRRRCRVLECGAYLDQLERRRPPRPPQPEQSKPEGAGRTEVRHWLREFADLDADPAFRELADPPEFFSPPE
jgi:hypothetical protein